MNDHRSIPETEFKLPEPSSSDLRGRQSVRATFKLSERAIEALTIVSVHLGIKQKSLFDHLMEDADLLQMIAREVEADAFRQLNRIQKTFVLSRRTLSCLERAAREFGAPRDALVELSIHRLLPVIVREREKHVKRKEILEDLARYLSEGERLLEKSETWVGREDPVHLHLLSAISELRDAFRNIDRYVERGKIIEDF